MLRLRLRPRLWLRFGLGPTVSTHLLMPAQNTQQSTNAKTIDRLMLMSAQDKPVRPLRAVPALVHITWPLCTTTNILQLHMAFCPKNVEKTTKMNCTPRAISDSQTHQHLHSSNSTNMAHFRLYHVNTDLLGRAIFRRVLPDFHMPVTVLGCMEGEFPETSVLEVQ